MPRFPVARAGDPIRTPATGFPSFIQGKRLSRIIAGDVWACLRHLVESEASRTDRIRALAYLDQAFEFHEAAANPQIGARPLLHYYAFLNATKAFLVVQGINLPPLVRHGISDPKANVRQRLRLEGQRVRIVSTTADHSELLPELIAAVGGTARQSREYAVLDTLLAQIPAIHRTYVTVRKKAGRFVPIREVGLLTDGTDVWATLTLDRQDQDVKRALPRVEKRQAFRSTFTRVAEPEGDIQFQSRAYSGRRRGVDPAIVRLAKQIRECGVWALLTRAGYRYYLGDFDPRHRLPQLASIYAAMFYLGSITRYKPYDFDRIVGGRYSWLVSEFLATQPRQFLYLLASTLAGVDVVSPYAVGGGA